DPSALVLDTREPLTGYINPDMFLGCHIANFTASDGVNDETPVITWETKNCTNELVKVYYDAVQPDVTQDCQLRSMVISEEMQGSVSADFMETPYIVSDGQPVDPGNSASCGAMRSVDVWIDLLSPTGLNIVEDRAAIDISYAGELSTVPTPVTCSINGFSVVNSTTVGELPQVAWQTDCGNDVSVQVKTTTTDYDLPTACRITNGLWDGNKSGGRPVDYMAGGYGTSSNCPEVNSANFWVELRDTNDVLLAQSATRAATYVSVCSIQNFNINNSSTPGTLPVVNWTTNCGSSVSVQVKATTTDNDLPQACRATNALWDGSKSGSRNVDFMVGGYGSTFDCPRVNSTDFTIELYDAGETLIESSVTKTATYTPDGAPLCTVQSFGVVNALGKTPVVNWVTDCSSTVEIKVLAETTDY
ncbi:MAG: hypothetical protein MJK04_34165, partial [Psychrosphaera sp.]|nr:hypothetical protein [Psychrosphaera sp.]